MHTSQANYANGLARYRYRGMPHNVQINSTFDTPTHNGVKLKRWHNAFINYATLETTDMTKVTAQQWLQKWGQNLSAAGPYITAGVNAVKTAPGVAAASQANLMLQNLTASVTSGQWAKAVSAVSLQSWQTAMTQKGIPHIAQGVAGAQANKVPQITALLNAVDNSVASIANLPKGGLENNIARATSFMRAMSANAPKKNA